jgi:acetoin utilization deacetylase AcuC-like enzyme
VFHERYLWHDAGPHGAVIPAGGFVEPGPHAESPERLRRIRALVEVSGLGEKLAHLRPRDATRAELERFHAAAYVDHVKALSDAGRGDAGFAAPVGPSSYEIATLAVGGCLTAVEAVVAGEVDNAYALVRPPGHHARADEGMGGCLFSNAALAAMHARQALGLERIAVIDWDAHHGNGTQEAFWDDPSVMTVSLHQDGCFPPASGVVDETGGPNAPRTNVNLPLPPGSGTGAFAAAFDRVVIPALDRFRPELVIVANGFDSCGWESHARFMLHSDAYRELTRALLGVADRHGGGRLVVVHEGGYSPAAAAFLGLAVLEELSGVRTEVEDPFLEIIAGFGYQELQPHQEAVIARAAALHGLE